MFKLKIIPILFIFLLSISVVSAATDIVEDTCPWWNPLGFWSDCDDTKTIDIKPIDIKPTPVVTYTEKSKTSCVNDVCNLLSFENIRYVNEDNEWKEIEKAKSLKDHIQININKKKDKDDNDIRIEDFNLTAANICIKTKKDDNLQLKTYKFEEELNTELNEYVPVRKYNKIINVSSEKNKEKCFWVDVNIFEEKIVFGEEILTEKEILLQEDLNAIRK